MSVSEVARVSIIIPTFNGGWRIGNCLDALLQQSAAPEIEILVVNDGSTDDTAAVVQIYPRVKLINQANAGPASARNRGASEATGQIVLFTDDDCVPLAGWLHSMLEPFHDSQVVGAKGIYRTRQKQLVARFVQVEYEDRYHLMAKLPDIDFIDTYSAAFRRDRFLEIGGYDTSFPVACAEDVEMSYRMSARGWKMKFVPSAIVYHTHPATLSNYLKKKYKFAFWRILAVRKNPSKGVKDSHTPQIMKLQVLFGPVLLFSLIADVIRRPAVPLTLIVIAGFLVSTLPFTWRAMQKDPAIGMLSPIFLALRSVAQFLGVAFGSMYALRRPVIVPTDSTI